MIIDHKNWRTRRQEKNFLEFIQILRKEDEAYRVRFTKQSVNYKSFRGNAHHDERDTYTMNGKEETIHFSASQRK